MHIDVCKSQSCIILFEFAITISVISLPLLDEPSLSVVKLNGTKTLTSLSFSTRFPFPERDPRRPFFYLHLKGSAKK